MTSGTLPSAPEPYPEEAPSFWISRVAHAHELSEAELTLHFPAPHLSWTKGMKMAS